MESSNKCCHSRVCVGTNTIQYLSCREKLRERDLFSLEKGRLWGDLTVAFQCRKEVCKIVEECLFTRICNDKTESDGFKLKRVVSDWM